MGLPIAVTGAVPLLPVAVVAMLVVGLSNALLDVAGFTLLQRGTPNRSRTAVFAVLETLAGLAGAGGALLASALVEIIDVPGALIVVGLLLPIAALAAWPLLRRLDREGVVPEDQAELLRGIPAFALLPLSGLERLVEGMVPARYAAGQPLMVEGDPGDRYIVLASGHVVVTAEGRELRRQGPGEGLGDIALLRRVPRTATVTAIDAVEGYEIDCATFVAAVAGHPGSAAVAEDLVRERLAPRTAAATEPAATIHP